MPRKPNTAKRQDSDADDAFEDDFLSDEDYFVEELRNAVARARSTSNGRLDLHDGPWGGGLDRLQIEMTD